MTTKVTVKEEAKEAIGWNLIYTHPIRESGGAGAEIARFVKKDGFARRIPESTHLFRLTISRIENQRSARTRIG
jgi:hypothetical protein